MIELARDIPMFRPTIERFVRGAPDALLLVEFAGDDQDEQLRKLRQLGELMGDLGFPNAVVEAIAPGGSKAIWEVRKAGLNIMMSMKGDGKPISFIEDCAVPLDDLADYTDRLTEVFEKHGTQGHLVRARLGRLPACAPGLEPEAEEGGAKKMRAIAEEAFAMVREYKGSHSGEHGDGLVRSEFHEAMFGARMVKQLRGGEGLLRSERAAQSRQDRAPAEDGRPLAVPLQPATRPASSTPRSTGPTGAASAAPSRCATTTAPAASSMPASCARPTA